MSVAKASTNRRTYKRACTAQDQKFESIWYRKYQFTSSLEILRFIHKYIRGFDDARKYHLDPKNMAFNDVIITNKHVITHADERKSRNRYDENENCNKKASDNNKSAE